MKRQWFAVLVLAGAVSAVSFFATSAIAANFQTYYCGTSTSYCTLNETGVHTASTALRDSNSVHCLFSTCHTDLWYEISGQPFYKLKSSNGAQDNSITSSNGNYAYSWCATTIGFGTNTARCWTNWHT
jgi:hypothetical protein